MLRADRLSCFDAAIGSACAPLGPSVTSGAFICTELGRVTWGGGRAQQQQETGCGCPLQSEQDRAQEVTALGEEGEEARGVGGKVRTPSRRYRGRRSATNLWGRPCGHRIQEGDRDPCLFD